MATYPTSLGPHVTLDDVVYYLEQELGGQIASVLPEAPSANGTYYLKCVKSNDGVTLSWAAVSSLSSS